MYAGCGAGPCFRRGDDAPDCSAEVFWLQGPAFLCGYPAARAAHVVRGRNLPAGSQCRSPRLAGLTAGVRRSTRTRRHAGHGGDEASICNRKAHSPIERGSSKRRHTGRIWHRGLLHRAMGTRELAAGPLLGYAARELDGRSRGIFGSRGRQAHVRPGTHLVVTLRSRPRPRSSPLCPWSANRICSISKCPWGACSRQHPGSTARNGSSSARRFPTNKGELGPCSCIPVPQKIRPGWSNWRISTRRQLPHGQLAHRRDGSRRPPVNSTGGRATALIVPRRVLGGGPRDAAW